MSNKPAKKSKKMYRVEYVSSPLLKGRGVKTKIKFVEGVDSVTIPLTLDADLNEPTRVMFAIVGDDGSYRWQTDWNRILDCEVVDQIPERLKVVNE